MFRIFVPIELLLLVIIVFVIRDYIRYRFKKDDELEVVDKFIEINGEGRHKLDVYEEFLNFLEQGGYVKENKK